jgi:hypothetical protein
MARKINNRLEGITGRAAQTGTDLQEHGWSG